MSELEFSHLNSQGQANMVDVTAKDESVREALAEGFIRLSTEAFERVQQQTHAKGDVLSTARIAGIMGAKKCPDLIPLCHPLALTKVEINFELQGTSQDIRITGRCKLCGKTGVEMEALTAVSVAALTIFDMCKAIDPSMEIHGLKVLEKTGGKTGNWSRG